MPADRRTLALVQQWLSSGGEDEHLQVAELLDRLRLAISSVSSAGVITFAQNPLGFAAALPNPIVQDLLFTDATYDIGKVGATRPRDGFFSRNLTFGGALTGALVADNLSSGTVPDARFPATLPAISGVNLTALNANNLGSGTVPDARFPATLPAASGVNLTALNATQLTTGEVPAARLGDSQVCCGRLTLTTAVPVTSADVTAAGTVYFTPYRGNRIALYDGATRWNTYTFTEKSLALSALTNDLPYDVFIYDNAGTPTLEFLAWTSKTVRATALVLQDGVPSKTGALTRRYLGTFHTTGVATTEDSYAKRLLWNYYNRVRRPLRYLETTDNWTYQTAAWRQGNGSTNNQVAAVVGVAEVEVDLRLQVGATNNNAGVQIVAALKEDSVTAPVATASSFGAVGMPGVNTKVTLIANLNNIPAAGYHFWAWLEYSEATGTTTWYGDNAANTIGPSSGIHGTIEG